MRIRALIRRPGRPVARVNVVRIYPALFVARVDRPCYVAGNLDGATALALDCEPVHLVWQGALLEGDHATAIAVYEGE